MNTTLLPRFRSFSFPVALCLLCLIYSDAVAIGDDVWHRQPDQWESPEADSLPPSPRDLDRIVKGAMSDGKLWLLIEDRIAVYDFANETLEADVLKRLVVDMVVGDDGSLYILSLAELPRAFQVLRRSNSGAWDVQGAYPITEGEVPLGLSLYSGLPCGVLTTEAVYVGSLTDLKRREAAVGDRDFTLQPSFVLAADTSVYWGRNLGEWGGGLLRRRDGDFYPIERRDSNGICKGPLNSNCDPVTALLPDPRRPDCIIVAVGLRHILEHGRILRVCGDEVQVLYEGDCSDSMLTIRDRDGESRRLLCTDAMLGLAAGPDGFWTVTARDVLQFDSQGVLQHTYPQPTLVKKGGIWLTTDIPGVVVVGTTVNRAASLSGYTRLVIPRE